MNNWLSCACCGGAFIANDYTVVRDGTGKPHHCDVSTHGYSGFLYNCSICESTRLVTDEDREQIFANEYVKIAQQNLFLSHQC